MLRSPGSRDHFQQSRTPLFFYSIFCVPSFCLQPAAVLRWSQPAPFMHTRYSGGMPSAQPITHSHPRARLQLLSVSAAHHRGHNSPRSDCTSEYIASLTLHTIIHSSTDGTPHNTDFGCRVQRGSLHNALPSYHPLPSPNPHTKVHMGQVLFLQRAPRPRVPCVSFFFRFNFRPPRDQAFFSECIFHKKPLCCCSRLF